MTTTKAKLEFVHAMARHTRATVRQCEALMRYAATLHRLAELACNGYSGYSNPEAVQKFSEAKEQHIKQKVRTLCYELGTGNRKSTWVTPLFSGDPRGAVLKIRVPDGYSNSFGGEGICVPS